MELIPDDKDTATISQISDRPYIHIKDMNSLLSIRMNQAYADGHQLLSKCLQTHKNNVHMQETYIGGGNPLTVDESCNNINVHELVTTEVFGNLVRERNKKIRDRLEEIYRTDNTDIEFGWIAKYDGICYEKLKNWEESHLANIGNTNVIVTETTKLDFKKWDHYVKNPKESNLFHALICLVKSKNINSYNSKSNHSTELNTHIEELDELNKDIPPIKYNKIQKPCKRDELVDYSYIYDTGLDEKWHVNTDIENSKLLLDAFNKKHKQEYQESDEELDEPPP